MSDDEDVTLDLPTVLQKVRELATVRRQMKVLTSAEKDLKGLLNALVEREGFVDEKGHQVFQLPESIDGIGSLVRQRRVSLNLDQDAAREMLESIVTDEDFGRTLWNDCVEYVAVLDEDKIMAAHAEGLLTDEQIDSMYTVSESYAFVPAK